MKNYDLKASHNNRSVFMTDDEPYREKLFSGLSEQTAMFFERPLNMEFEMEEGYDESQNPLDNDMLYWSGFAGWLPKASYCIVSNKLKVFFEGFNLPNHTYYAVNLRWKGDIKQFYIFHLYDDFDKYIDFDNCRYTTSSYDVIKNEKTIIEQTIGGYSSTKQLRDMNSANYDPTRRINITTQQNFAPLTEDFEMGEGIANLIRVFDNMFYEIQSKKNEFKGIWITETYSDVTHYVRKSDIHLLDNLS